MSGPSARAGSAGFTVTEALVSLVLGLLIGVLVLGTLARQRRVQADLTRRGEVLGTLRTTRVVLGKELRAGDGSEEVGADTLALRAFRGIALVCPGSIEGRALTVLVEGIRAPDPAKDSVRLLLADGSVLLLRLAGRGVADPCPGASNEGVERWTVSDSVPVSAVLARYFERGSYHLTGGALRYRRGEAGRQPLTPQVLRTPPSAFGERLSGVEVRLFPRTSGDAAGPRIFLGSPGRGAGPR